MHVLDMCDALDGMVCLVDTREQDTPRLRARLKTMGCPYERKTLDFGDYSAKFPLSGGEWFDLSDKVVVERKMHVDELCHCYCQDRERFTREFERAKEAGAKVYLIIEDASYEKMYLGKYRSKMRSSALIASLFAWLARYNCQIVMCTSEYTGKIIYDILYREAKERLERGDAG